MKPPPHPREQERLQSLRDHQILDTSTDRSFDDLVQIASQLLGTPTALVSLIDQDRQWFKACIGMNLTETRRDESFCGYAICADEPFIVEDATKDKRFRDNPLVTGAQAIRFYAGAKVCDDKGLPLGTLCVIDHQPRSFSQQQREQLDQLARQASRQLAMHRVLHELSQASTHDELTGLLNRRGLDAHVSRVPLEQDQTQALLYLDMKRFKPINDSHGHHVGDAVLKQLAKRLEEAMQAAASAANGTTAQLARLGGDEFGFFVSTRHDEKWVRDVFAHALLDALVEPFVYFDNQFFLGASIGIVTSLPGQRLELGEALSNADIAMARA